MHGIIYEVLIASPSDVNNEREIVAKCVANWNSAHGRNGIHLKSVRWEMDAIPAVGDRPQGIINEQLVDGADILIGIFKARIGTPTGLSPSGTIEEIERFVAAGKPVMLYFLKGPIPNNHDAEQFRLLREYKSQMALRAIYAEFETEEDFKDQVGKHLAGIMARVAKTQQGHVAAPKTELARVFIRTRHGAKSGDVNTVRVIAVIENISQTQRINSYVCDVSVPSACLTHASTTFMDEVREKATPVRRVFRHTERTAGGTRTIFNGDEAQIFCVDIGVDQLKMKGTYLAGDYEGTMAAKVEIDAVVEGEAFHAERTVADIFANPTQN